MKTLSVIILLAIVIIYVLIGGAIFWALESEQESKTQESMENHYQNFLDNNTCVSGNDLQSFIDKIITAYDQGVLTRNSSQNNKRWDYVDSVFFAVTCVSTIGYGNQAPITDGGRIFFIFYTIIGIAITGFVLNEIGTKMCDATKPLRKKVTCSKNEKIDKIIKSCVITLSGFGILIFIPSAIFHAVEGWTFLECVYYCIVTLTTVGFGDFVAGTDDNRDYIPVYRTFVAVWLILGLAWVALTIGEVSENFKAKSQKVEDKIIEIDQQITGKTKDEDTIQNGDADLETNDRNLQFSKLELKDHG